MVSSGRAKAESCSASPTSDTPTWASGGVLVFESRDGVGLGCQVGRGLAGRIATSVRPRRELPHSMRWSFGSAATNAIRRPFGDQRGCHPQRGSVARRETRLLPSAAARSTWQHCESPRPTKTSRFALGDQSGLAAPRSSSRSPRRRDGRRERWRPPTKTPGCGRSSAQAPAMSPADSSCCGFPTRRALHNVFFRPEAPRIRGSSWPVAGAPARGFASNPLCPGAAGGPWTGARASGLGSAGDVHVAEPRAGAVDVDRP